MRAIYDDSCPHIVLVKAAQIGGTTWAILRSLHSCLCGLNVGYLFPTKTDVLDFSRSRVAPLLAENDFLARAIRETDTAGLKRIGEAFLFLRGMVSDVSLKSIPLDVLVFDELDEATPEAKSLARERLSHSQYGRMIELSNPSLPGLGIDEAFQQSDQRRWTIRCDGCGYWVALDTEFPTTLGQEVKIILPRDDGRCYRACPRCAAELDLAKGEWVAEHPGRPIHGYAISQLHSTRVDPGEILKEYRLTRYADHFYNLKIGIPYSDLNRRLDLASVLSLCSDAPMLEKSDEPCLMGVDTGKALHVVILREDSDNYGTHHLVHLTICKDFAQLDDLMKRFTVDRCVIDGMPETHATGEFARAHPGKVYMCFFSESQRGSTRWDHSERKVTINRTEALDASRAAVRDKKVSLPRRVPIVETFAKQMTADAKKLEEDEQTGAQKYHYIKTGENHFSFAFTYAWMASSCLPPGWGVYELYRRVARQRRRAQGLA